MYEYRFVERDKRGKKKFVRKEKMCGIDDSLRDDGRNRSEGKFDVVLVSNGEKELYRGLDVKRSGDAFYCILISFLTNRSK